MEAGAYDVLVKPIGESTLLFAVHRAREAYGYEVSQTRT